MKTLNATSKLAKAFTNSFRKAIGTNRDSIWLPPLLPNWKIITAYQHIILRVRNSGLIRTVYIIHENDNFYTTAYIDGNDIIVDTAYVTYCIKNGVDYL